MISRSTWSTETLPVHVNSSSVHWPTILWQNITFFIIFLFWRNRTLLIMSKCLGWILVSFLILEMSSEIKPESCESKEQRAEMACHSHGIREQTTDQLEQKESTSHTNAGSATVSTSKSRSRTGRKPRAKKWVHKASMSVSVKEGGESTTIISLFWCFLFSGLRIKLPKTERSQTIIQSDGVTEKQRKS